MLGPLALPSRPAAPGATWPGVRDLVSRRRLAVPPGARSYSRAAIPWPNRTPHRRSPQTGRAVLATPAGSHRPVLHLGRRYLT